MATLARSIAVNTVLKTLKNIAQFHYFVDGVLSNPINKRYRESFENRLNLKEIFKVMSSTLKADDMVKISNGTKTVQHTVNDWNRIIDFNLKAYNDDPQSEDCNVWINVTGKTSVKEDSEIDKL